jgi:MraZ protein
VRVRERGSSSDEAAKDKVAGQYFSGSALSAVDAKGRVSIPAAFRAVVEARCGAGTKDLYLRKHDSDPCFSGYDRGYQDALIEDLQEQRRLERAKGAEGSESAHSRRSRNAFGTAEPVSWDGSGRIVLPDFLKRRLGIADLALFVGAGDTFEIWEPRTALESGDEELRELAAYHLEARGAKA